MNNLRIGRNRHQFDNRVTRFILYGLSLFYAACLTYIVFFARRRWGTFPKRNIKLIPFHEKILYLQAFASHTSRENSEFYQDVIGNVLLFIPFPFLLSFIFRIKKRSSLFIYSALASLIIEIIQYTFNIGVADIDDWVLNTIGASIGLLVMWAVAQNENGRLQPGSLRQKKIIRLKIK